MLKSQKTNTLADWLIEVTSLMLDEIASKTVHKDEDILVKTLNEVEPVKKTSKNLQIFLEISPVQKEVLPSHKLQDHAYE